MRVKQNTGVQIIVQQCIFYGMSGESGNSNNNRREKRHQRLLAIARDILVTEGMIGLSIQRLAKLAGITRPTVYSHFRSKQVLLTGVAEQNIQVTRRLMERASSFEGSHRERAFGMILGYEVMARFETEEFHMTEFFGMPWVRTKLPEEVAAAFAESVSAFYSQVRNLVEAAIAAGELILPRGMTAETLVFHSLSMSYGMFTSIIKERIILQLSAPVDAWQEARDALQCFWDGAGWKRESEDADYGAVAERFLKELFPNYWIKQEIDRLREREGMLDEEDGDGDGEGAAAIDRGLPFDEGGDEDWDEGSGEDVD